ncbi:phosphoribosylamine--glycine ligase [candidate division WOR-3 bacterium JGI_Cruoil_03_44_89]|uniref:Phosphoribosylamine--glycine ligase n=1 Tax=candidate division WOR-3 bacterium JGI_Cruoil_03_44_89 TaxID=1973748 RepID=A0A235BPB3_UNCW3|nr:MAG: phosphoribosylamine--glycine ligase [candidate division WOR-3 bacterium JGI_Cruoil_03_44_89]
MRVAVIGGGGREHALVWKLSKSPQVDMIYALPGNGGIGEIAECVDIKTDEIEEILRFVKDVDYVIVGPEVPLSLGLVDLVGKHKGFGPTRDAALVESSKAFAKDLMKKTGLPTADFDICRVREEALLKIRGKKYPLVIKASGLAAGKGAFVVENESDAREKIEKLMVEKILGEAGKEIVIEDFLRGEEVSVLAFTDGKHFLPLIPSQDHKRLLDGDKGPNTGGMGAYAPVPFLSDEDVEKIIDRIFEPAVYGLKKGGIEYKGVLYAGLMITDDGPKVLEFNVRFGDPETQAIIPLMESDLMELILATIEGRLGEMRINFNAGYSTCVVLASSGYPGKYEKGKEITGFEDVDDAIIFHAGTKRVGGRFLTNGGRVLGVTATGDKLEDSIEKAYGEAEKIHFDGVYMRRDIGNRGVVG